MIMKMYPHLSLGGIWHQQCHSLNYIVFLNKIILHFDFLTTRHCFWFLITTSIWITFKSFRIRNVCYKQTSRRKWTHNLATIKDTNKDACISINYKMSCCQDFIIHHNYWLSAHKLNRTSWSSSTSTYISSLVTMIRYYYRRICTS